MSTLPPGAGPAAQRSDSVRQPPHLLDSVLAVVGGLIGACVGYYLFLVIARQGFYAIVLPGALTGIACGGLSRHRSLTLGITCAILGTLAGILAEWRFAPFIKDDSLTYFLMHLHQLKPFSQFMIVLGGFLAFWFGLGRTGGAWPRKATRVS